MILKSIFRLSKEAARNRERKIMELIPIYTRRFVNMCQASETHLIHCAKRSSSCTCGKVSPSLIPDSNDAGENWNN